MPAVQKIEDYKQYHLWAVESTDNEACYIRIKEKDAANDDFLVLLQTVDCHYTKGDAASMEEALQQARDYIDANLS
jgi:hypothetical protein